ncbi:MAG: MBOAT family protein [Clostridiales bacterium]|nr:MBOAT family protein [Clostridiales bacterium]
MLFVSYEFIAFVIILFLLYYLLPKKWQWPLLLIASYAFYFIASPYYLVFIGTTTVTAFIAGILMEKAQDKADLAIKAAKEDGTYTSDLKKSLKARAKASKWRILLVSMIFNLGILAVTKYTNFVITNINKFLSDGAALKAVDLIIPMGISFYTFQTVGYLIDTYRGTVKAEKNVFKLALFVSFFPQLVQGPISRYGDLSKTLYEEHKFTEKTFTYGLMRILWGYFKKVVIADRIITAVTTLIGDTDTYYGSYVFIAMLFYAFELYCDFTGGIDITIGIAQCLGITVAENFNLPYFSKNIKEYWNRWHITMGSWFTDYIFYPLSVDKNMLKLSKWSREHLGKFWGKRLTVYISAFIVWFATGVWHGAAWNFIVWGLMNFVVIMISQELEPLYEKFHKKFGWKNKGWYGALEIIRTILLMSLIRMFDCYRDVPMTFKMVSTMFTKFNFNIYTDGSLLNLGITGNDYAVLAMGLLIILLVSIYKYRTKKDIRDRLFDSPWMWYGAMSLLFIITLLLGAYGHGYDATQFIYNQF